MREARDFSRSGLRLTNSVIAHHSGEAYRQQLLPLSLSETEGHECLAETDDDANTAENARAAAAPSSQRQKEARGPELCPTAELTKL